jgi:hypothetical protein
MKKKVGGAILGTGVMLGLLIGGLWPERVVEAQTAWLCRAFTLEEKADAAVVGTWLATARTVHMASAGLSAGSRFAVVVCKQ